MTRTSPWLAVTIGLLGLVLGYSLVVAQHPEKVFAGNVQCPSKAACKDGNCDATTCKNGTCGKNCPGCAKKNPA